MSGHIELVNSIHELGRQIVRSPLFDYATLQPTRATLYDPHWQQAILLYKESEYVDHTQFASLGTLPNFVPNRRGLSFYLAADSHVYYGYARPYSPIRLAAWSVRQLHAESSLPQARFDWTLERLHESSSPR